MAQFEKIKEKDHCSVKKSVSPREVKRSVGRSKRVLMLGVFAWCLGFSTAFAQSVTFNLKDADITTVIATIADITGKNFIIDPRVKGKATVISSRPMTKDEAYEVFLSLLEVHGYATVDDGRTIKILPDVNAKQSATRVATARRPGSGDEMVTRVIDIEFVTAAQLVPILRPLVPQQGHLVAYAPSNVLIISDRASNIKRLLRIIKQVDRASVDNEVEVVTLEYASAAEVVRILNTLSQQENKRSAAKAGRGSQVMIADERTNSILLGGDRNNRIRARAMIAHLDTPMETEGNTHVIYLKYAKAVDLVPVLTGVAQTVEEGKKALKGKVATQAGNSLNIQAEENSNALVITAPPDVFRSLRTVIRQLDIRRAQVSVEAIIAEVNARRASELGVQWLFGGGSGTVPAGAVNFTSGTSIADLGSAVFSLAKSGSDAISAPIPFGGGLTLGAGRFNKGSFNFGALLRALEGDGAVNVLSTPNLVTLDNVEAEIKVGQVVPFVTGSYTAPGGGGSTPTNPFQTIDREDVGITLKVTPQINEGNAVKLDIEQTVSSVEPAAIAAGTITSNRSIKTSVLVDDGQTIVLGGLISEDVSESVQRVPLLGSLPLIGALFRTKTSNVNKENLMIFIRPTILRDAAVTTHLTNSKYNFMRAKQLEVQREGSTPLDLDYVPLLPERHSLPFIPKANEDVSGNE
ncbi:General secretion pathway protein D [hydrothermal vent metagenome]|uniref:General secretion pathway protein D n=1 Tax=hydrothermal vent metagenome TaxID=652676 RepID=A0A3B0Z2E6_9ZZZZ